MTYDFVTVNKRVYIYTEKGKYIGRVQLENGKWVEYPEPGVMWLPTDEALKAIIERK